MLQTAGAKRRMENEDDSGSSEDFDAVPLDFLFELDPWLFGGLDGDAAAATTANQDAQTLLLSPSSLSATASTPRFASFPTDNTASVSSVTPTMIIPAPVAAPSALSTPEAVSLPPPIAPAPPRLAPGPPPSRSFVAALTSSSIATPTRSSSSVDGPQPARKKAKPNKSTSQRQKEELTFLRSKVEELEEHLSKIKSSSQSKVGSGSDHPSIKSEAPSHVTEMLHGGTDSNHDVKPDGEDEEEEEDKGEASLWERIAKRQQEEKTKAEVENMKLREMVEGQIKLVRSFERLLRKRQIWEQLQEEQWHKGELQAKRDDQIFDELLTSIDARRPLLERIFETNALHSASPEGGDASLKYAATNGMYIEFKDTKFLPFDHNMIDDVMWRSIREGKIKLEDHAIVTTKESGDAIMSKGVVTKPGGSPKPTTVWSTVKRFVEADHFAYIYETTVVISSMPGTALPPVKLVQQGWGRLAAATLRDGSKGTVMQSYLTSVPTVLEAEPRSEQQQQQQHREIDILTELIFTSYQQSRQTLHQVIENLVLDEALARGTGSSNRS